MKNNLPRNCVAILLTFFVSTVVSLQTASALALCITNPKGWADDPFDNRCAVNASVTPDSSTVVSGGSTGITFTATGIFESGNNSFAYFDTWKIEDITGDYSSPVHVGGIPTSGTFTRTASGNSGILTRGVTVTLSVGTQQGVDGYDSAYIAVASAPSVSIQFSFLEKINNFISDLFATRVLASK